MSAWFRADGRVHAIWRGVAWLIAAIVGATVVAGVDARPAAAATLPQAVRPVTATSAKTNKHSKAAPVASRPDMVSAAVSARSQGSRVQVENMTTESSTTWVNPDGTITTQQFAAPVRYQDAKGTWQAIDLDLASAAGAVQVKHGPSKLALLGAGKSAAGKAVPASGTVPVVAANAGAHGRIMVGAKKKYAAPKLAGRKATYQNVGTGADLAVESTRTGFESFLHLKDAAAVKALIPSTGADAGTLVWSFPLTTSGGVTAKQAQDGGIVFVDAKGSVQGRMGAPLAWDAPINKHSGLPENTVEAKLRLNGTGAAQTVSVIVDGKWATDPDRVFPITVDPTYASATLTPSFDAYVQSDILNTDQSTGAELRVGTYDGGTTKARSFLNFPTTALHGKTITAATLKLYETWSYSCTARGVDAYRVSAAATTATRYANQPSWTTKYGSASFAAGYTGCAAKWQSIDVTNLVKYWAGDTGSVGAMGIRASSETDSYGWKRFSSKEGANPPSITYTYDRAPNTAAAPTFTANGTYGGVGYVQGGKATFSTKITDPDANKVKSTIEIHNSTTVSGSSLVASCTTGLGASGATISCANTTDMTNGGTFYVRAKSTDELGLSASSWSAWTTIKRAGTAPSAPTISCPGHGNGSWTEDAPSSDVTCTVATVGSGIMAATTLNIYVDGATTPTKTVDAKQAVTSTTVTVSKAKGGHAVRAVAVGGASLSTTTTSSFGWGNASLLTPVPYSSTSGKVKVSAAAQGNATPTGKLQWRVSGQTNATTGWKDATGATVTVKVSSGVATATTTWDTTSADTDGANVAAPERTPVGLDLQVCFTYPTGGAQQCTWAVGAPISITRLPHAFGAGYPTTDAGVGTVAQVTGELNTTATDVSVPGLSGDLSISRSTLSFTGDGSLSGWPDDYAGSMFGPGWTGNLDGPDAGTASMNVIDQTTIDGTIVLLDDDGSALVWQQPGGGRTKDKAGTYVPVTQDTVDDGSKLVMATGGTSLSVTDEDGTVTTYKLTGATWGVSSVAEPGAAGTTTYTRDSSGRVTRILSGLPDGYTAADCPGTGALTKPGCRALDLAYNPAGQVTGITAQLWDPATSAIKTTPVSSYSYDSSNRLTKETDPRTGLATQYGWDGTSTRLASVTPAGQAAYRISYDGAATAGGRVKQITRDAPTAGGSSRALFSFVYGVPTSGTGLPSVTASDVAGWAQASAPSTGYAVFGADHPVSSTSPSSITAADWPYATLSYVDAQNYDVTDATYGAGQWLLSSTDYDAKGNTIRSLTAEAINGITAWRAANPVADASDVKSTSDFYSSQTTYNDDITDSTGTVTVPAGTLVVDSYTPQATVTLPDGRVVTARNRTHTSYDQGAPNGGVNPATSAPYSLATTVTETVDGTATGTDPDVQISKTTNSYTPVVTGDGDGWALGSPVTVTTNGITKVTRSDTAGRTLETRAPSATGTSHPLTTRTVYYTAGTNGTDAACGNKPQWSGSVCRTFPGAAPSAGPAILDSRTTGFDMWLNPTTVVETSGSTTRTTTTKYDGAGRKTFEGTTTNLASAKPRAATFTHYRSTDGLVDYAGVANAAGDGATSARTTTGYDLWGRKTSYTNDQGDVATTTYDTAGRVDSVTDPKGTTTYGYDGTDAKGKVEHRGLTTKVTITRPGAGGDLAYSGAYDDAGTLVTQDLPGQVTATTVTNELKQPIGLTYTGQVTPVTATTDPDTGEITWTPGTPETGTWLAWTMDRDAQGRIVREYTGEGAGFDGDPGIPTDGDTSHMTVGQGSAYDRAFSYDAPGRLTKVVDRTMREATGPLSPEDPATWDQLCDERAYTFNADGARTKFVTTGHNDGDCGNTTAANLNTRTVDYSLDTADRLTTASKINGTSTGSYAYDALGRQTTIPASDTPSFGAEDTTLGYFADDLPASVATQGMTTTFTLDADGRRLAQSTSGGWYDGENITRHYTDDGDNPSWETTNRPGQADQTMRFTDGLTGDLGAMIADTGDATINLVDPHDNNVTGITIPATQAGTTACSSVTGWSAYTEYGGRAVNWQWTDPTVAGPLGYGWLGGKQRPTTGQTASFTLMGVRYYNWVTGTFTSPDPVPGGNDTSYGYPGDPINNTDITGQWGWPKWRNIRKHITWKNAGRVAAVGGFGVCVFMSAGACLAAGVVGSVISARASAGRFGGRKFRRSLVSNLAYTAVGHGVGRGLAKGYQISGGARYSSQGIRRGVRGYRAVKKWKYRPSYYWHSAKLNAMQSYMSNRWGW